MATITFRKGGQPYTLHQHFSNGGSLTHDEASVPVKFGGLGIGRLAQRVADLNNKFVEAKVDSPLMVVSELNEGTGKHTRYFYKGCGCEYEHKEGAKSYKE